MGAIYRGLYELYVPIAITTSISTAIYTEILKLYAALINRYIFPFVHIVLFVDWLVLILFNYAVSASHVI